MATPAKHQRPIPVWLISFFFFIRSATHFFSLTLVPLLLFGAIPITGAEHRHFDSQNGTTGFVHFISIFFEFCNLGGAIFLFLLRRPALYFFGAGFVAVLFGWAYLITFAGWSVAAGSGHHLAMVLSGLFLYVALLVYVWYLDVSNILR